jgi:hypothetical protein
MNNDFIVISYEYWLLLKDKDSISWLSKGQFDVRKINVISRIFFLISFPLSDAKGGYSYMLIIQVYVIKLPFSNIYT